MHKTLLLTSLMAAVMAASSVAAQTADEDYELVFADEFDLPDGSQPDPTRWKASTRRRSTWNRWVSDAPEVAVIKNGCLICRAIPNPDTTADPVPMLTGAVETQDLFSFTYGRVEVRLRVSPFNGSFPAAWMMPQPPCASWPNAGEIDIFESIDVQPTAYHTVHTHWTYDLNHRSDPVSSFSERVTISQWHVYALEWTADALTFTVDGKVVGRYPRSTSAQAAAQGQWPFDHPFYIILNQSVGDGSWARAADTSHTYETRFDYVRVYQRRKPADGIEALPTTPQPDMAHTDAPLYDLAGRRVDARHARPGIYVCHGRRVVMR
ncbi:MAG: glycoside hydrolase family 16 protein [Bacteroidaceae bacterium]|nr:glycoside hydrolase family 16 protein [Bacteroidaceae bacterium]